MSTAFEEKMRGHAVLDAEGGRRLQRVCQSARETPADHDLAREGDALDAMFVILRGWACRYKTMPDGRRQILAFLMPGDFSDIQIGLLDELDHSIGTLTAGAICAISAEQIGELVRGHPGIARAFHRAQLIDESVSRAWIASLGRRTGTERVAHLMCELYVRLSQVGLTDGDRAEMPLTQITLSDALGLTPVHVNRIVRKLQQAGIMELRDEALFIYQPAKLALIAGFNDNYLHRRAS